MHFAVSGVLEDSDLHDILSEMYSSIGFDELNNEANS